MSNSNQSAQMDPVYAPDGNAINGYDPVAYFTDAKPIEGSDRFTCQWKGVGWKFASQQNLEAFKTAPEKYVPQYGGYCAYGMSQGHKASTVPKAWTVVSGKLYLNHSLDVKEKWDKDRMRLIEKADAAWAVIKK